jgi:hypothetical protein
MSRIRLIAVDSRGDLQSYLAILLELQHRGHQVTLIGSVNFQAVAEAHSVQFVPLPGDFTTLLNLDALLGELLETAHAAMEGTDLLLVSPLCLWGYHLSEALVSSIGALASEPCFRKRARELQGCLAGEDGVAGTVGAIEAQLVGGMRKTLLRMGRAKESHQSLEKWFHDIWAQS